MQECRKCKIEKPFNLFVKLKDKYSKECRECNKIAQKQSRSKNQKIYNEKARQRRHERKLRAIEYKGNKCNDCGLTVHPAAFDFHHIDPKIKDKDPGLMMGCTDSVLFAELDKCLLLCSNCHRIRHFIYGYK